MLGRWTVLHRDLDALSGSGRHAHWVCRCSCGEVRSVNASMLNNGRSLSCGCLQAEQVAERNTKHGHYGTRVYGSWHAMSGRCRNPSHRHWKHYGGRGITVTDRWLEFPNFLADMGEPPSPKHSLDRIDNNGNYEPGNCRWATPLQQQSNRRNNVRLTFKGETASLAEWARRTGITVRIIRRRIKNGWSVERALT